MHRSYRVRSDMARKRNGGHTALMFWSLTFVIFVPFVAIVALAAGPADVEERTREIASELRCVVCQNLSVADSPSELAKEMRQLVREQVEQGKTREEILAYFTSRYGEFVLLSPTRRGFNLLVWGLPFVAVIVAAGGVYLVARRWTRQQPEEPAADAAYVERVRQEWQERRGPSST